MSVDFTAATADEIRACFWALTFYQFEYTAGKRTSPQDAIITGLLAQLQTRANNAAIHLNLPPGSVGSFLVDQDVK